MSKAFAAVLLLAVMPVSAGAEADSSDDPAPDPGEDGGGILEYGIGVTALNFPHYPGSDQTHTVTLPFPYLTYYSERVDVDGGSVRGTMWQHEAWSLDISSGGALPVDADDNDAREGMPDLGWLAEIGPALRYSPAWSQLSPDWQYRISLPIRQAVELDGLEIDGRGWIVAPNVQVQRDFLAVDHRWEFQARASVRYASQAYNQHFHGVDPAFATAERPAFQAEEGISAYTFSTGLGWRRQQWWIGGFIRYSDFSDSVVRESPLIRDRRQASFGLSAAYILGQKRF